LYQQLPASWQSPGRITSPETSSRVVKASCNSQTPASAVISGTLSCATAAVLVLMRATAAYNMT